MLKWWFIHGEKYEILDITEVCFLALDASFFGLFLLGRRLWFHLTAKHFDVMIPSAFSSERMLIYNFSFCRIRCVYTKCLAKWNSSNPIILQSNEKWNERKKIKFVYHGLVLIVVFSYSGVTKTQFHATNGRKQLIFSRRLPHEIKGHTLCNLATFLYI